MSELLVVFDREREIAAIVNVDDRCGWGPAMVGPQAGMILQTFLDTVPFDVSSLSTFDAKDAFVSFLERTGLASEPPPADTREPTPQSDGNQRVDDDAARAQHEAHNASDVPPEQPADTDEGAGEGAEVEVRACPNCNGEGELTVGDPPVQQQCPMCKGDKVVKVAV